MICFDVTNSIILEISIIGIKTSDKLADVSPRYDLPLPYS